MTTIEAAAGQPIMARVGSGQVLQFDRISASILVQLGSYHRAVTGRGASWLTLDECMQLVQTIEGMQWLAWRCAVRMQPEFSGDAGRAKFMPLVDDFQLLTELVGAITQMPEAGAGADPTVAAVDAAAG